MRYFILFILGCFCIGVETRANSFWALLPEDSNVVPKGENMMIYELDFGTNIVFRGKKSSSRLPYVRPNYSFYHHSGFNAYVDATYILGANAHWDQYSVSLGYMHTWSKKYTLSFSYTHNHYNPTSEQVAADLQENPSVSFKIKFKPITLRMTYDYYFGTTIDHYATIDFYRYFYIDDLFTEGNDYLGIKPKFSLMSGTTHFFTKLKKKKDGTYVPPTNATRFNIMNYYFSLNLPYTYKRLTIEPAFGYNIPVNQPKQDKVKPYMVFALYTYLTF